MRYKELNKLQYGYQLYIIYRSMCHRCNDKNTKYKYWNGKGIEVCDEWENDFMAFYKWSIENGYKYEPRKSNTKRLVNKWSIDRIDGNGNYEPSNCRWVDINTQNANIKQPKQKPKKDYNNIENFDYTQFKKIVKSKGLRMKDVFKSIKMNKTTFYRCLTNGANFGSQEIREMALLLGKNEILDFFFPNKA